MPPAKSDEVKGHNRPDRPNRVGWRRILFPLAAIFLAVLPFLLLEGTLRILGIGGTSDPANAGFAGSRLFELDDDEEIYTTARQRLLFFNEQSFAREKPDRTFRIFGLGGSTVHGRPYASGSSFLKWLELELNGRDSTREYETVNCGGLSYASYRLTTLLDEVLQYDPDLIVVATGHNEFLEDRSYHAEKTRSPLVGWVAQTGSRLRTVAVARQLLHPAEEELDDPSNHPGLEPEVEARLDKQSGYGSYHRDEAWRQGVIDQYEESLRKMVDDCRMADVPLVFVNLGENLRDCPPFKSEHRAELSAESLQRWQAFYDQATELDDSDPAAALKLYEQAEAIDGEYALLAFRIARCCDRLGDTDRARVYYGKARQLDICPLRMVDELHERLKQVAGNTDTPIIDAESLAVNASPDGIPGNNCFMDHVHPDIGSHQQVGKLLADEVESMGLVEPNRQWTEIQRRRAYRLHFRRLGPAYLANGRRRVSWLENWARSERLDEEAEPKDARGHMHLGKKRLDYGEIDAAWEQCLLAMAKEPERIEEVLDHAFQLFSQGRGRLAQQILVRLHREPVTSDYRPVIKLAYVVCSLDSGDRDEASNMAARYGDSLDEAVTDPKLGSWIMALPDVEDELLQLLADRANLPAADPGADPFFVAPSADSPTTTVKTDGRSTVADLLDRAIARNPESAPLYLSRARMRFSKQDYEAALADTSRSIELAPDNPEAYKFRAILHMIQTNAQAAVDDLNAAITLDVNDPELLRMRAAAYRRLGEDAKADADLEVAEKLSGNPS